MLPRLELIPKDIPNEYAKLNVAVLHPQIFSKLKSPQQDKVYVKVKEFILTCMASNDMPLDRIGMSKKIREFVFVNMIDTIVVEGYLIPVDKETSLSYLQLELELKSAPAQTQLPVQLEDQKLVEVIKKAFTGMFFRPKQSIYITYQQLLLSANVLKAELIQVGAKSLGGQINIGRVIDQTEITFIVKEGQKKVRTSNAEGQTISLFRPDFKISDMGIGGLGDQLANIFRRAFASRRFPPQIISKLGIKHVKGILLFGPPGTGKTLIARQLGKYLKAKQFKVVNGPELFSKYVGESEQNVRKLFDKARQDEQMLGASSPLHIIVFDEFDAMVKQRGNSSSGSNSGDLVVNQLLTQIDGVKALNNILVIGMTNRKDLIDEAILRPGRLQVHIEISLPDEKGRQEILKIHTLTLNKNNLLGKTVDLETLARMTNNYTGAEIEGIVKSASSFAMTRQSNVMDFSKDLVINDNIKIEMEDFEKSLAEIKPQFGVDEQKFDTFLRGKIYDYGVKFNKIIQTLSHSIEITKTGTSSQLNSVILEGKPGTGKTSIAAHFARQCSFPYVKLISPQNFMGFTSDGKINAIVQIFQNAYKSTHACIIIDDLQRLIDFIDVGSRFNNNILQGLLVLVNRLPKNAECRLLLIGTTSSYDQLVELELSQSFNIRVHVPRLSPDQIYKLLIDLNVQTADAKEIAKQIGGISIKQFLQIKEMARGQNVQKWTEAFQAFKQFQFGA